MDYTNRSDVFNALIEWEWDNGECILDGRFGSDIREKTFMIWCVGAGYITSKQFDSWLEVQSEDWLENPELQHFLYDESGECEYAVVKGSGDWNEFEYRRAYKILAHFISSFTVYQDRFEEFLRDGIW